MPRKPRPGRPRVPLRLIGLALLAAAALVSVTASASAATATGSATPKLASLRVKLRVADGRLVTLRRRVADACPAKAATPRCHDLRARLASAAQRSAALRQALRRRPPAPVPATTRVPGGETLSGALPAGTTTPVAAAKPAPVTSTGPATGTDPGAAPAPAPAPAPDAPAGAAYEPGVNASTWPQGDMAAIKSLGARTVRLEFDIASSPDALRDAVTRYAAAGVRVLPLAGFYGRMPTVAEARNLATWATTYGPNGSFWAGRADGNLAIRQIEFGNETSMTYQYNGDHETSAPYAQRARTYALRLHDAAVAIRAAGSSVGLMATDDDWSGNWIDNMYAAVPSLHDDVAGWTIHPYGPTWKDRLKLLVEQTARHGAGDIPIDITEIGITTDDGRCLSDNYGWNRCFTYTEAAAALRTTVAGIRGYLGSRLRTLMLYQVRDLQDRGTSSDREMYFGLMTKDSRDKGAFTAQARLELAAT